MLNELSDEVRRFTETKPLLETVARCICDTLHIRQIALLLRRGDSFYVEQAVGVSADGASLCPHRPRPSATSSIPTNPRASTATIPMPGT